MHLQFVSYHFEISMSYFEDFSSLKNKKQGGYARLNERLWQERTESNAEVGQSFEELLRAVANFSDPLISGEQGIWETGQQEWIEAPQ
jgi:hypothetical protein